LEGIQKAVNGGIHVSYHDANTGTLKYAVLASGAWKLETVATVTTPGASCAWCFTAIAVDRSGIPHIVYYDDIDDSLRVAVRGSAGWTSTTIDSATGGITAFYPSIAMDAFGTAHVAYLFQRGGGIGLTGRLRYAVGSGATWSLSDVDTSGDTGYYPSIAVDASGDPHIAYVRYPGPGARASSVLRYATGGGRGRFWTNESLDSSVPTSDVSLALDTSGRRCDGPP